MKQFLSEEVIHFLNKFAANINVHNERWSYMPLWFKENSDGSFESFSFEQVPEYVKHFLEAQQNKTNDG